MIPKIIHYCWLSKDPYPESIQKCIDSWKKFLPDYEIWLWNFDRFPRGTSKWVDQAFDSHKYAFAADYIRLYALYHYGGVYLDSDVEVLKSFDDLLSLPYFIGQENTPSGIEAATIGCEPANELIKLMLSRYEDRSFVQRDGSFDMVPLPYIFRRCIETQFQYVKIKTREQFIFNEEVVNVFPVDWFSPKTWDTKELNITNNTYSIHHFSGSWLSLAKVDINNKQCSPMISKEKSALTCVIDSVKRVLELLLFRKDIIILTNSPFAVSFCGFLGHPEWNILNGLVISKDDLLVLIKLCELKQGLSIEFIRDSNFRERNDFYPIARLNGTSVVLHFSKSNTKDGAELLINNLNKKLQTHLLVPITGNPQWNTINLFRYYLIINICIIIDTIRRVAKIIK